MGPVQAPFTARRINRELSGSASIAQLAAVFTEHRAGLDTIHLATTLTRAAKLVKQQHGGRTTLEAQALIASVLRDATPRLGSFTAQGLANAAHALASVGEFDAPFFVALAAEARQPDRLGGFDCQNLANTAYAYGQLAKRLGRGNQPPPYLRPLLAAVMKAGRPRLQEFDSQAISNTLVALAWAGVYDAGFVEAAIDSSRERLPQFEPQHLSNVAWALQQLRHRDVGFMRQLQQQAVAHNEKLSGQNISNIVYAAARLATWGGVEGLGQLGARLAATSPSSFSAQAVANLALAHAVMGLREPWLVGLVVGSAARREFIPVNEAQLHLYAQALAAQPGGVPPQLQQFTGQWAASASAGRRGAFLFPFAATVLGALQRMGEDATAQPASRNAMAVRQQDGRAVTVVGVDAFGLTCTQPPTLMGTRLLDLRLAAGAKGSAGALAVTEPEWRSLGGDAGAQEALLRARLAHAVSPFTLPPPSPLCAAAAALQLEQQPPLEQQPRREQRTEGIRSNVASIGGAGAQQTQQQPLGQQRAVGQGASSRSPSSGGGNVAAGSRPSPALPPPPGPALPRAGSVQELLREAQATSWNVAEVIRRARGGSGSA